MELFVTYVFKPRMENVPDPKDLDARRERRELLYEIAQVQSLTASISARMKRLRGLEEDIDRANTIASSITTRMRKLEMSEDD